MISCRRVLQVLPQYIADGEPRLGYGDDMCYHLTVCPACRAHALRLRRVENALRTYPLVSPVPETVASTLRQITRQERFSREEWQALPWDIWVPALAILLAIVVTIALLPPQLLPSIPVTELGRGVSDLPTVIATQPAPVPLQVKTDLFWALWIGLSAILGGIGLSLGLSNWSKGNSRSLGRLETRVTTAAVRLWEQARHTR
jgi:hypothetical protein